MKPSKRLRFLVADASLGTLGQTIRVDDCSAVADSWPWYSRVAAEEGVKSTLSLPFLAAGDLAEGLRKAMESRATIEQAKGMLMASPRCSAEAAFQMLVSASQRSNVKLRDLAERIVASSDSAKP